MAQSRPLTNGKMGQHLLRESHASRRDDRMTHSHSITVSAAEARKRPFVNHSTNGTAFIECRDGKISPIFVTTIGTTANLSSSLPLKHK
jgi:hypothetical protein